MSTDDLLYRDDGNILITGGAGAGKTTTVKRFIHSLSRGSNGFQNDHVAFISLKFREIDELSFSDNTIVDCIRKILSISINEVRLSNFDKIKDFIPELIAHLNEKTLSFLEKNKFIILLDGFDEISSKNGRISVLREIKKISEKYPSIKIIVTCRNGIIEYPPVNFTEYEIAPFDDEQIDSYIFSWFGKKEHSDIVRRQIDKFGYKDIAIRPINLSYICAVYDRIGEIPQLPRDLYEKVVSLLLHEWDNERFVNRENSIPSFNVSRKREFLCEIAFYLSTVLGKSTVSSDQLKKIFGDIRRRHRFSEKDFLNIFDEIEEHTSIFIRSGAHQFEFSHKTLQEFLCAERLSKMRSISKNTIKDKKIGIELAIANVLSMDKCVFFSDTLDAYSFCGHDSIQDFRHFLERVFIEDLALEEDYECFDLALRAYSMNITELRVDKLSSISSVLRDHHVDFVKNTENTDIGSYINLGRSNWSYFKKTFKERYVSIPTKCDLRIFSRKKSNILSISAENFLLALPKDFTKELLS